MKKLLALVLALLLALPSGFALADDWDDEEENDGFWGKIGASLTDLLHTAEDNIIDLAEQASPVIEALSEEIQSSAQQLFDNVLGSIQEGLETGKEKASGLIEIAEGAVPVIWENIKDSVSEGADAASEYVRGQLQRLLDWIKGDESANENQLQVIPRALYFDAFYFGMPLSEAKLLGMGPTLGSPVVDEANGVQYWTARFSGSWDTAVLVFNGLEKDAPLAEIIYTVVDGKGAVAVTEETKNSAETIDAVYDSISSWFSGEQEISLGDVLPLSIYPGAIPAGSTVSRVRMFLFADGKGYNAATHFVLTGENGPVNMVQYQYVDAAKLESLLAE